MAQYAWLIDDVDSVHARRDTGPVRGGPVERVYATGDRYQLGRWPTGGADPLSAPRPIRRCPRHWPAEDQTSAGLASPRRGDAPAKTPPRATAVIEKLLPPAVVCVEAFVDIPGESVFPGEEHLVVNAVEARRREFVTARRCAREALEQLGYGRVPIRHGRCREPQWPPGVIGSITHCTGFRAAAVAPRSLLAGIGIDGEPHEPLPRGVAELVAGLDELGLLTRLRQTAPAVHWDRLLFSAKEAIYKAWYPLCGRWLGFDDARLDIDPARQTFTGHLRVDGTRTDGEPPLTELRGHYLVERGLVLTAVTVATMTRPVMVAPACGAA